MLLFRAVRSNASHRLPLLSYSIYKTTHSPVHVCHFSKTSDDPPNDTGPPKVPIELVETDLIENFIKGGGPGGQKINKSSSCVQLKHVPTGISVKVKSIHLYPSPIFHSFTNPRVWKTQRFRELQLNRKEARKLLQLALDDHFNGEQSKRNLKMKEERTKKAKAMAKSKKKYQKLAADRIESTDE